MKRLVIAPHPDDAEFGLGAAIARWVREGDEVMILVVCGEGDLNMVHSSKTVDFAARKWEQCEAARVLGAKVSFISFAPASKFDTVPMAELVSSLDFVCKTYDAVYAPLPSYNVDHEIVWKATLAAFRPGKLDRTNLFAYEQLAQLAHGQQVFGPLISKVYIEVDLDDMKAMTEALKCHKSQIDGREESSAGLAAVRKLAALRGLEIGVNWAHVVYPVRQVCLMK